MKDYDSFLNYQVFWWLFKIGVPFAIPWLIYNVMDILKHKKRKAGLNGKVVMITGANSGLGEAMAHVFYSCSCKLILVARRKPELQRVKDALLSKRNVGPTYVPIILPIDLTEIGLVPSEIAKILKMYGRIDILINNAGISYRGEVDNTKLDTDIKVMLINYFAQIALSKAVLSSMIKQNYGHIVYTSSVQGKIAIPYRSAYAASKHALQAWCDSARAELYDKNISITVVNPGYVRTALSLNAITGSGEKYGIMDETTAKGYSPKEVAEIILKAVLKNEKEITIATFSQKLAIVLRTISPSVYFWIMKNRARRLRNLSINN